MSGRRLLDSLDLPTIVATLTLVAIGLFIYYPAASGIYHSFFRWNGADISEWQGFGNYTDLLTSSLFWHSFRNAFMLGMWTSLSQSFVRVLVSHFLRLQTFTTAASS